MDLRNQVIKKFKTIQFIKERMRRYIRIFRIRKARKLKKEMQAKSDMEVRPVGRRQSRQQKIGIQELNVGPLVDRRSRKSRTPMVIRLKSKNESIKEVDEENLEFTEIHSQSEIEEEASR